MPDNFLTNHILDELPFVPTDEQYRLITCISDFIFNRDDESIFLLRGYAGTGKTSVISALIRTMLFYKQHTLLLAPTGRAAKVMSQYSGQPAYTIHKKIYRQDAAGEEKFSLNPNIYKHTFVIVDEGSMISNNGEGAFGTGYLLDDLITFIYCNTGCRMLIVDDDAQLPPVGEDASPALSLPQLESYGLNVTEFRLHQVVRQSVDSGILANATSIRSLIDANYPVAMPRFFTSPYTDVERLNGMDVVERLNDEYRDTGVEDTIVITRSNKQALIYNRGIRSQVIQRDDEIGGGDLVMITKNNYFWGKDYENIEFIANGDMAEVIRTHNHQELYGFRFADTTIRLMDYDIELNAKIIIDSLYTDTPQKMKELSDNLFRRVSEDYLDITNKRERMKQIMQNEYYNALQLKFGYAVTCHKAQGGQWHSVFIDQGALTLEQTEDYYHWLYTSITRATDRLYLVNFPKECFNESD